MKLIYKKFKYRKGIFVARTQNKRKNLCIVKSRSLRRMNEIFMLAWNNGDKLGRYFIKYVI